MKFKALPTGIALLILGALCYFTSSNKAAVDGADKFGFPFIFYFKFAGKSSDIHALRHYFSIFYLIADIFVGMFFIVLVNKISLAIFKQH